MMAFSLGDDDHAGMNEINLIPLIDVMLVLMIIFMVTASVVQPSVPLTLPDTNASVQPLPPSTINLSINADGGIFIDNAPTDEAKLLQFLKTQNPESSIYLRADKNGKYDTVAKVLAIASEANLGKIAFVNE